MVYTHNIHFHGEIRKKQKKRITCWLERVPYLELCSCIVYYLTFLTLFVTLLTLVMLNKLRCHVHF